jgi:hypothetical protein
MNDMLVFYISVLTFTVHIYIWMMCWYFTEVCSHFTVPFFANQMPYIYKHSQSLEQNWLFITEQLYTCYHTGLVNILILCRNIVFFLILLYNTHSIRNRIRKWYSSSTTPHLVHVLSPAAIGLGLCHLPVLIANIWEDKRNWHKAILYLSTFTASRYNL